jgi:hypothetical protein
MALAKKHLALLATIIAVQNDPARIAAETPFDMQSEADVSKLVAEGLVETNAEIRDGDKVAVRATEKGIALNTENSGNANANEAGPTTAAVSFDLIEGAELPAGRGGRNRSVYPFDKMNVGQSFFVPATDAKPNPAKSLASTVASANKRNAKDGGSKAKFDVRKVTSGVAYGTFTAPSDGALVKRIA